MREIREISIGQFLREFSDIKINNLLKIDEKYLHQFFLKLLFNLSFLLFVGLLVPKLLDLLGFLFLLLLETIL